MPDPDTLVFVYGSLKQGFCNHAANRGVRLPGRFVTAERYPLWISAAGHWPWLLQRPGDGHRVAGELYTVDAAALARMDRLERIDEPGNYLRRRIVVIGDADGARHEAWVYFGSEEGFAGLDGHIGPIDEYRLEHQQCYVPFGE